MDDHTLNKFLRDLDSDNPATRINAVNHLGESRDELCLTELRKRLKDLNEEHHGFNYCSRKA